MNIAVILAGGKGSRLGGDIPKQMLLLGNKPVISWAVDTFHKSEIINKIIIVSEKSLLAEIKKLFPMDNYPKIFSYIEGGIERSDSSYNAIKSFEFNDDDNFLFHDAARPFVSEKIINAVIEKLKDYRACGTYIKATDTVTVIEDSIVKSIPERNIMFYAQTPQGFKYGIIKRAHEKYREMKNFSATDDVSLALNIGIEIGAVEGSDINIKITTQRDLRFAEFIISDGKNA